MGKLTRIILFLILSTSLAFAGVDDPKITRISSGVSQSFNDDISLSFGSSDDFTCEYDTAQTPDTMVCGVGTDARSLILMEKSDISTDMAHAQQTNPTLFVHSADATNTTYWIGLTHNQTNGVLDVGAGVVSIPDGISTAGVTQSGLTTWSGGTAMTAASYQVGRDADTTNQMHLNVPTGAGFEFSVNDTAEMTLTGSAVNFQNNSITTTGGGSMTGTWSDLGTVTTIDINGGTVDGVTIGGASAGAGTFTTLTTTGLVAVSTTAGITASTTQTQGNGALTTNINEVSVVANTNDTVTLPAASAGLVVYVFNNGANTMRVYPASGDNIDGTGVNTQVTQAAGANLVYVAHDSTNWNRIHGAL